jgi:uncharacterized protein YtpQ (UPF0354 family)
MQSQRRKFTLGIMAGLAGASARAQQPKPDAPAPPAGGKNDIVPLVRSFTGPIRKTQEIRPVTGAKVQGDADLAPLIDTFVGDLDIRYAYDAENGFRYLNERDLKTLNIARDQLLRLAVGNFRRRYPKLTVERPLAFIGKIANGGELEPSLMLDTAFWETEKARPMYAGGEIVAAAPARDVLWFTSVKPAENVRNLRENTERSHKAAAERAISKLMYMWRNQRWEVLDA